MLQGTQVALRLFAEADLEQLAVMDADIAARGEHFPVVLHSLAEMCRQFEETGWWQEDQGRMAIVDTDGRLVGAIVFFRPSPLLAGYEVGYTIFRPEDRGRGYMTEALRIFSAYLFALRPIPRLQLGMFQANAASRRVAEKCGYRYEGTQRSGGFLRGEFRDRDTFSLLRSDCPTLEAVLAAAKRD